MYGDTPEFLTKLNESRMPIEYQKSLKRQSRSSNSVVVETFGAHDFMWSPPEQILPYTGPESYPANVKKPTKKETFAKGEREIERAWKEIDNTREDEDNVHRFDQLSSSELAVLEARLANMPHPTERELAMYMNQQKQEIRAAIQESVVKKPQKNSAGGPDSAGRSPF